MKKAEKKSYILMLPSLVGMGLCFLFPLLYIIISSFRKNPFSGGFAFFDNFKTIFNNPYFLNALKNSALFTVVAVLVTMATATLFAAVIYNKAKQLPFIKSLFVIPYLLPSSLLTSVWSALFPDAPPFLTLTVLFVIKNAGLAVMLLSSALCRVSEDIISAAAIDGARGAKLYFRILLPSVSPTLLFTFILTLSAGTGIYRESYLLYGEYPDSSVYMIQNYLNNHFEKLNYQYVSAAALVYTIAVMLLAVLALRLERRYGCE